MTIETVSTIMAEWLEITHLTRTLLAGTVAMRNSGEIYSSKGLRESDESFNSRVSRMILKNMYKKTCQHLTGQVFQKEIFISPKMPPEITELLDDIDGQGNNIHIFASKLFFAGISTGVGGLHVNTTSSDNEILSRQDAIDNNVRPYFRFVPGEDIVGFKVDSLGLSLTGLRLSGDLHIDEDAFSQESISSILSYSLDGWELYSAEGSGYELIETGSYSSAGIPFVSFTPGDQLSLLTSTPPMDDMAYLQLGHWGSFNDQGHILHIARVPLLFSRFAKMRELNADVATLFDSDETDSTLQWVELQGSSLSSGREDVKDWENSISLYGLQQLAPRTNNATATEKRLASAESSSTLGNWVVEFELFLQASFELLGETLGVAVPENCCELNKEFDFKVADSQLLASILQSQRQGIFSKATVGREFIRRGAVSGVEDLEVVNDEINSEFIEDMRKLAITEEVTDDDL